MSTRRHGGQPRRVLSGVAILALGGAMMAPLSASADDDPFVAPGSPTPESKIQNGELHGAEALPHTFFVEFTTPTVLEGGSMASMQVQRDQFLDHVDAAGVDVEVRAEYGTLWSGLSVSADEGRLTALASSEVVEAIYPVAVIDRPVEPQADTISPQMATAVSMTGVDQVHEMGIYGEGVRVGVIDSGIDYDHPDFGGSGEPGETPFPTEKVAYGYDFVGDTYNASPAAGDAYQPNPMPDDDPDDCMGHGTHVAGIVAADGEEVTGVAPGATLGAYRVFGCAGSTGSDIILQALERSLADEMDVVNMSLGAAFQSWPEYPTAVASDALAAEGVVVVASAGNEGANGLHAIGAPSTGLDVLSVGSVENTNYEANVIVDGEGNDIPYQAGSPAPEPPTEDESTVVAVAEPGTVDAQHCDPFTAEEAEIIEGNYVLIQRGECTFYEKAFNGQEAGATGVIIYNNVAGSFSPSVAGDPPIEVPVIGIGEADGSRLVTWALDEGSTTVEWTEGTTSVPNPVGGLMSSFSSIGTLAETTFKPDLSAPGGLIYSTYPLEIQPYATLSGTSMAAPHAAGAVALMLEADPDLGNEEVRTRLQNSSDQLDLNVDPDEGLELVHRQGSGLIQIDEAILAETVVEPSLVQLGQQFAGVSSTQTVTLHNSSDSEQTFALSHEAAVATQGTANDWAYVANAAQVEMPESLSVPAGESATIEMTITSPEAAQIDDEYLSSFAPIYGGYVHFTTGEGEQELVHTISYGGYAHDLQDVEVLADLIDADRNVVQELPALGRITACEVWFGIECVGGASVAFEEAGAVYTMTQIDHPRFLVHLEHQARHLEMEVFSADPDGEKIESLGVVTSLDYLGRDAARNSASIYTWDGKVVADNGARVNVPDGNYVMDINVTKASAWNDDRDPSVESWTSPYFTIDRGVSAGPVVERVAGPDGNRYSTASQLAQLNWPNGADTVFVANAWNFPDALAGGAHAGSIEAPILLTQEDNLPAATRLALGSLEPERIVVLGGDAVVSGGVMEDLGEYADTVERLSGEDRYETAVAISTEFGTVDAVFLASGLDYPDALAAAAAAGMEDVPVLLTHRDRLMNVTAAELERLSPDNIYVVGGENAISRTTAGAAGQYGDVTRLGGTGRWETAALISDTFFDHPASGAFVATGWEFADALAAAPVAGMNNQPVLLTRTDSVPNATVGALLDLRAQVVTIVGGYDAVSLEVQQQLEAIVYP